MLKLDLSNKERWLDLGHGVKVKVKPMTTQLMLEAQSARATGADETDESLADTTVNFAAAVARHAITDWTGVGDEAGKAVSVSAEGIDALMRVFPIFTAFQKKYINVGMALVMEKNGSAPSLTGTTAAARNTAKGAKAPAKSARRAKTRP